MDCKKARIYTGTGDCGTTSLAGGTRVPKNHVRVCTYGTIDELNAHLGLLAVAIEDARTKEFIEHIEQNLLTIGGILADERGISCPLPEKETEELQHAIDRLEASLPPMREFIIPGGTEASARANLCRTVCRRAERELVGMREECGVEQNIMTYMNRLSDYLFLLQRQLYGSEEKKWEKPCK